VIKRKRGRPKSTATIERESTESWLRNIPEQVKALFDDSGTKEWLEQLESVRQEILSDYKHDPTIPNKHAYEMASLGDESMFGHENDVLARGHAYRARSQERHARGALSSSQKSMEKARWLCEDNSDLIERMESPGGPSLNSVVTIIADHWHDRGVTDKHPSKRTLTRWIIKFRQARCELNNQR
jgi:hypothetical protein